MKYVVLSFDDGRKNFFTNALPILQKYKLPATLNIISDFMEKGDLIQLSSYNGGFVTWEEMEICRNCHIEIASHSANHTNDIPEILRGVECLRSRLGMRETIGFASPNSEIGRTNFSKYVPLLTSEKVKYIRSGNQLRRDGLVYAAMYYVYKFTKWKWAFSLYNRRNIISLKKPEGPIYFPSVNCNNDNSMDQLTAFLKKMPDKSACIVMLHSVLQETDAGYREDKWSNTASDFEKLCATLAADETICTITNAELCEQLQ